MAIEDELVRQIEKVFRDLARAEVFGEEAKLEKRRRNNEKAEKLYNKALSIYLHYDHYMSASRLAEAMGDLSGAAELKMRYDDYVRSSRRR